MKKHFYTLLATTGMLLATSCSHDDLANELGGESTIVTFKVNLPEETVSRATTSDSGKGESVNSLIFAMYEEDTKEALIVKDTYPGDTDQDDKIHQNTDGTFTVSVPMAKDIKYDLLFLAYNNKNCPFTINQDPESTNLRALQFKTELTANVDAYDTFVGKLDSQGITKDGTTNVTLKRPLAQINAASSNQDLEDAELLNATVTESEFRIYGVPSTYDVFGETTDGEIDVVFKKAPIPSNKKITTDGTEYSYLALAYVLAGETATSDASMHKAEFLFYRENGKQVSSLFFDDYFPIKRNHRTNVLGSLLTKVEKYSVNIQQGFEDNDNSADPDDAQQVTEYVIGNETAWTEMVDILKTDTQEKINIKLGNDITARSVESRGENINSSLLTIHANKTVILDLNGCTLSCETGKAGDAFITNNGNLTIIDSSSEANGKIVYTYNGEADSSYGKGNYTITNLGTLNVESGTIENATTPMSHASYAINTNAGATLNVKGGQILNENNHAIRQVSFGTSANNVTIDGGHIEGKRAIWVQLPSGASAAAPEMNLTINGGTLKSNEETYNLAIYAYSYGQSAEDVTLIINDGNINGNVAFYQTTETMKDAAVTINGGTFNSEWGIYSYAEDKGIGKIVISGGTFSTEAKDATNEALLAEGYIFQDNENATYTVVQDGAMTLGDFVDAVIAGNGTFDGEGIVVKIKPASGTTDNTNGCKVPDRLQKYSNPEVYYAQYQRFAALADVNICNVMFEFVPAAVTVADAWNTAGAATTTVENINGELQFMNNGKVTLTNCTFNMMSVSPINAAELKITNCTFNGLQAYAIKDIKSATVNINNNTFTNCNGGFWFADAPQSITANGNTFTGVGRRGAIQFSKDGDYAESEINIEDNKVDGAFLWQLNNTVSTEKIATILENNTYTKAFVDGSNAYVKIGNEVKSLSLIAATVEVADGGTITLLNNEKFTKDNRSHNSGDWYDGLYYIGDKSFTIDLNGLSITQDGSVNDYLLNFKNDASKENTITLKNGTIDAGTAAYCAICTSGTSTQKLTINLENIAVINNNSNGSTIKIRGGAELNVNSGAIITGQDSYLGIEAVASTVNIYDGAEIYMNGKSSYNGCLVGACGMGTVNVYGGYGKGVKGGFIAMTSGGTINVSGGEWIANTDGTVGDNSNLYVLTSQNNSKESGYLGASIINVTGGTFCGGMDAWILNQNCGEVAELNIQGGNFNANPTSYVETGFEATENNGTWTVTATTSSEE